MSTDCLHIHDITWYNRHTDRRRCLSLATFNHSVIIFSNSLGCFPFCFPFPILYAPSHSCRFPFQDSNSHKQSSLIQYFVCTAFNTSNIGKSIAITSSLVPAVLIYTLVSFFSFISFMCPKPNNFYETRFLWSLRSHQKLFVFGARRDTPSFVRQLYVKKKKERSV